MGALRDDAAVPAGSVAVAAVAWRYQGTLRLSIVAKATFELSAEAVMQRVDPAPIVREEVHHGNSPMRSIRLTTDLVPYLNHADVLLTGHAYAPGGVPVETMPVRLGVFDGARAVLDKMVIVRQRGGFQRMPLVYEHAYGGAGFRDNPLGIGFLVGSAEPNLVDPRGEERPAGFGPIGQDWSARRKLRGSVPRSAFSAAVIELPHGFDWDYFQAAPPDQRVDFLRGDEWIVMDGLHPQHARLRSRLPGATGHGRIHGLLPWGIPEGQGIELHADVLRIDGDKQRCTLTFRGTFPLPNDARVLGAVRVIAGVELPGEPVVWPELAHVNVFDEGTLPLSERDLVVVPDPALDGTLTLPWNQDSPPAPKPRPVTMGETPLPGKARPDTTITLDGESPPEAPPLPFPPSALPWVGGALDAPPPGAAQGPGGTLVQDLDEQAVAALRRGASVLTMGETPKPPAQPLVSEPEEPTLKLRVPTSTVVQELDEQAIAELRSGLPFVSPVPPAPPPPSASAPAPPPPEPSPAPAPEPIRPVSGPEVRKGLYGRFGDKR